MRKLIGVDNALIQTRDHLSLNQKLCWVDSWQFERLANRALNSSGKDLGEKEQNNRVQKALDVYRGDFLASFQDEAQRQHLADIAEHCWSCTVHKTNDISTDDTASSFPKGFYG